MSNTYADLQFTTFPDSIQSFVTMLNMTVADGVNIAGYQKAIEDGNNALAQQYYNNIINGNQKIIDAEKMNTLMQTCVALQRFFSTDIQPYIDEKQTIWENRTNQFNYKGVYSPTTQYQINNFVLYNIEGTNRVYICIKTPSIGIAPTNTTYWRELSIRGEQGESGVGLSFRYAWSSAQTYYVDDVVSYNNSVWLCTARNSNQAPSSQSSYWTLIYSPRQVVYPFQSVTPTGSMDSGYLWFKII